MQDLTSGASTQDMIALGISGLIFLVTIVLVARQAVNFFITLILLFFATVSGFAIANNQIVKQQFESPETQKAIAATIKSVPEQPNDSTFDQVKARFSGLFEQLVDLLSNQPSDAGKAPPMTPAKQAKVQELIKDIDAQKDKLQTLLEKE
jgi:flagellar motility protein MotE (MotC chaperone)